MTAGTVVVLPNDGTDHATARGRILNTVYPSVAITAAAGPEGTLAARICAAISASALTAPITLVAFGATALVLPSIALAQRAAHRRVREYVLVDPTTPPATDAWPDAPVTVYSDNDQQLALLRGWTVRPLAALTDWTPDD